MSYPPHISQYQQQQYNPNYPLQPQITHPQPSPIRKAPKPPQPSPVSPPPDTKTRAYSACKSCRTKKIKCHPGPTLPSSSTDTPLPGPCQQCVQSHIECIYNPSRDRAAYSRQYVQNLEARVKALEEGMSRVIPVIEAVQLGGIIPAVTNHINASGDLDKGNRGGLEDIGEEEEDDDNQPHTRPSPDMEEDAGQMTQDERGNYRWIGSSNTFSLLDSFSHSPNPTPQHEGEGPGQGGGNPYFGPVAGSGVVKALPGVEEVSFPSPKAAGEMVDMYFEEVHPCLPVMAEWEFREGFRRLMLGRSKGLMEVDGGFIAVVFAVFALGERAIISSGAWKRERGNLQGGTSKGESVLPGEAEAGVIWYERAQILHYTTLKDVNIHQVQCLTLMAAFQASVNAMPMSWMLAGQALRVAQDLGLHRSASRLPIPFAEKQIRSRCWWAIYGLERLVSISLGRPLGVDDLDIDASYPLEIDDQGLLNLSQSSSGYNTPDIPVEPNEATMSGFIALTKLCKIAGRVAQLLYRPSGGKSVVDPGWASAQQRHIDKLDKGLRDWLANDVPAKYLDTSASTVRRVQMVSAVLASSYYAVMITLHRNFLPSTPDFPRPRPPPNSQSLSHCVDAARSRIHSAAQQRVLIPPSHHVAIACQYLWSSAVILLLCEVQAKEQVVVDAVGGQVESCRRSLQAMEPVWPGSRKLKELLNDVEKRAKEVVVVKENGAGAKKRKSSGQRGNGGARVVSGRGGLMSPGTGRGMYGSTGIGGSRGPSPDKVDGSKRVRVERYETSDTRTLVQEDAPTTLQHPQQQQLPQHDFILQQNMYPPTTLDSLIAPQQSTFDVGGVTFDGLDMLQGFMSNDTSDFWDNFVNPQFVPTPNHAMTPRLTQSGYIMSGQNTPGSTPGVGGMGVVTQGQGQGHVQGQGPGQVLSPNGWNMTGDAGGGLGSLDGLEFWSQVGEGKFNWGADPSVPFNV